MGGAGMLRYCVHAPAFQPDYTFGAKKNLKLHLNHIKNMYYNFFKTYGFAFIINQKKIFLVKILKNKDATFLENENCGLLDCLTLL